MSATKYIKFYEIFDLYYFAQDTMNVPIAWRSARHALRQTEPNAPVPSLSGARHHVVSELKKGRVRRVLSAEPE